MVAHEAAFVHGFLEGFGLRELPVACWRGVPPIASGLRGILMYAKVGIRIERWFAQNKPSELPEHAASTKFTRDLLDAVRSLGWSVPEPQYIHQDESVSGSLSGSRIAEGLERPAQLDTNSSSGVRVCLAAFWTIAWIFQEAFSGSEESLTPRRRPLSLIGPAAGQPVTIP